MSAHVKNRRRKYLASIGIVFVGILFLVASALAAGLYSEVVTRFVLSRTIEWYNTIIPGKIEVEGIHGRLGRSMEIQNTTLKDRTGQNLATIGLFSIKWSPLGLFSGNLDIHEAVVKDINVVLLEDATHSGFGDLAPISDTPDKETEPLQIELPMGVHVNLRIADFSLVQNRKDGTFVREIVKDANMVARITGRGAQAELLVEDVHGNSPAIDFNLNSLDIKARLDNSSVHVDTLNLTSNWGDLSSKETALFITQNQGRTKLEVRLDRETIFKRYQIDLQTDPKIKLEIQGQLDKFTGALSIHAAKDNVIQINFSGGAAEEIALLADILISNINPNSYFQTEPGQVNGRGKIHIQGQTASSLDIDGSFKCTACRIWPVDAVDADMAFSLRNGTGKGQVKLDGAGVFVDAQTELASYKPKHLTWKLKSRNLAYTRSVFAKVVDLPPLSGSLDASGHCENPHGEFGCEGRLHATNIKTSFGNAKSTRVEFTAKPLLKELPFTVKLISQKLSIEDNDIDKVTILVKGNLDRINCKLDAALQDDSRLATRLRIFMDQPYRIALDYLTANHQGMKIALLHPAQFQFDTHSIEIKSFALQVAEGTLRADGRFSQHKNNKLRLSAENLHLDHFTSLIPSLELEGTVRGEAKLDGTLRAPRGFVRFNGSQLRYRKISIGDLTLFVDYHGKYLTGRLDAQGDIVETLSAKASAKMQLDLTRGIFFSKNDHNVEANIDARGIHLDAISSLVPNLDITGKADFNLGVSGTSRKPIITASVSADTVSWRSLELRQTRAQMSFENDMAYFDLENRGTLSEHIVSRGFVPMRLDLAKGATWLKTEPHKIDVDISGIDLGNLKTRLQTLVPNDALSNVYLSGRTDISARLTGTPTSLNLVLYSKLENLGWLSYPIGHGSVRLTVQNDVVDVHAQVRQGKSRYADLKATIPIDIDVEKGRAAWHAESDHHLAFKMDGVDRALLAPIVTLPPGTDFQLRGAIDGSGSIDKFSVRGEWNGYLMQQGFPSVLIRLAMHGDEQNQEATLALGPKSSPILSATLKTGVLQRGSEGHLIVAPQIPVDAQIELPDFSIAPFSPFLPSALFGAKGTINGQITAQGFLPRPEIRGRIQLKDGEVTITELNQRMKKIGFVASISGTEYRLDDIKFTSGRGTGKGTFRATQKKDGSLNGKGSIQLKKFPFVRPGIPEGYVDIKLLAKVNHVPDATSIELEFRDTVIKLFERSVSRVPKDIPEDSNVSFSENERKEEDRTTAKKEAASSRDNGETKVILDLTDPVEIRGPGIDMRWAGKFTLHSRGKTSTVRGGVRAFPGQLQLLQNTFEIESGEIRLPSQGVLDPFIRVQAKATTAEAEITATMRGRLSKPELTLSSIPPMSQYQIVSLLVTGRSDTTKNGDQTIQNQAASLLLAFRNPKLERQLYSRLGIDRLDVTLGQSINDPIFTVGKRLGKKIYVETNYHLNAPKDENQFGTHIEYWMTPSWSIETLYGDAQKGEVGVYWRKNFDSPPRKPSEKKNKSDGIIPK